MMIILCTILILLAVSESLLEIDMGGPYVFITSVNDVIIAPRNGNFSNCEISDELPPGLSLNSENCSVYGIPTDSFPEKTITILAHVPIESSGRFVIKVEYCSKNAFEILRKYGSSNVDFEVFSVSDLFTGRVLVNVTGDTPRKDDEIASYRFCDNARYLKISIGSTVYEKWYAGSSLTIYDLTNNSKKKDLIISTRFDRLAGMASEHIVDVAYMISPGLSWSYFYDSLPRNWESTQDIGDWRNGRVDMFPMSSNQIQIYKRSFASIDFKSGTYELNLRYMSGCIVYVNGIEVYRDNLPPGNITEKTVATRSFSNLHYRSVILSAITKIDGDWKSIIVPGSNQITVGLFHTSISPYNGFFDGSMRFTGDASQYRSFSTHVDLVGITGTPSALVDVDHETYIDMIGNCSTDASITISFNETRRDVISRIELTNYFHNFIPGPTGFTFEGRISDIAPWVTLNVIREIAWTHRNQTARFWVHNTQPYNAFRLIDIKGVNGVCNWRLSEVALYTERWNRGVATFEYPKIEGMVDIALGEITPSSTDFYNVTVSPLLPDGFILCRLTGVISGIPTQVVEKSKYEITAVRFDGAIVRCDLWVSVTICAHDKSVYFVSLMTDSHPWDTHWSLYRGIEREITVLNSGMLVEVDTVYHWSFCLDDDVYSAVFEEVTGSGWTTPSAFTIAVNKNLLPISSGTLPRVTYPLTASNTTVELFTHQPVQPQTSVWHVCSDCCPKKSWNSIGYNDHEWKEMTAPQMSKLSHTMPTYYLRRRFAVEDLTEFNLMNVQLRFVGGIIAYFNGNIVFRLNIQSDPAATDFATADHDGMTWSRFSVLLQAMEAKDGENVLAIEIHLFKSTIQNFTFDCIAVLAGDEIEPIMASYKVIEGSEPYSPHSGVVENMFDLKASTTFRPVFRRGTYWHWIFESVEIVPFDHYMIMAGNYVMNHSWTISGRYSGEEKWLILDKQENVTLYDRKSRLFKLPKAMAGFKEFRYEVTDPNSSVFNIMEFYLVHSTPFYYNMCATEDLYLAAGDGEIRYVRCALGYLGVASKLCTAGMWGQEDISLCVLQPPSHLHYPVTSLRVPNHNVVNPIIPTFSGIVTKVYSIPPLPLGLELTIEGRLYGVTDESVHPTTYKIVIENDAGMSEFSIVIEIYDRYCRSTKFCERTKVGDSCQLPCDVEYKNTVGTAWKECIAHGPDDGEWGKSSGNCSSMGMILAILFLSVVIAIFLLVSCISMISKKRIQLKHRVLFPSWKNKMDRLV